MPLTELTPANVTELKEVCRYDTGLSTSFQTMPIVVGATLYFTTDHDTFAIDAASCALRWRHHLDYEPLGMLRVNRGAAFADGKIVRGLLDGRLIAVNARTGRLAWEVQLGLREKHEWISAAPIASDGRIFVGIAAGDYFGVKGRMYALDARNGRVLWETVLVPRDLKTGGPDSAVKAERVNEAAAGGSASWGDSDPINGGGTWTSYSFDAAKQELYVPTANPAPDFVKGQRPGANLLTNSITVLDARTGAYLRHYPMAREDFHDWDSSSAPALIDTTAGRMILAPSKDDHLYGFTPSDEPGDRSATLKFRQSVTSVVNASTPLSTEPTYFCPGALGGIQWNGPAYSPTSGLAYVNNVDWCTTVTLKDPTKAASVALGQGWTGSADEANLFGEQDPPERGRGWLTALDPLTGKVAWSWKGPAPMLAGVSPTAGGIVFTGDLKGNLLAFNAGTGAKLLERRLGGPIGGGVISYAVDGRQFVAAATGLDAPVWAWKGGPAAMIILSLGNHAKLGSDLR